jgi:hypothetical protein
VHSAGHAANKLSSNAGNMLNIVSSKCECNDHTGKAPWLASGQVQAFPMRYFIAEGDYPAVPVTIW